MENAPGPGPGAFSSCDLAAAVPIAIIAVVAFVAEHHADVVVALVEIGPFPARQAAVAAVAPLDPLNVAQLGAQVAGFTRSDLTAIQRTLDAHLQSIAAIDVPAVGLGGGGGGRRGQSG